MILVADLLFVTIKVVFYWWLSVTKFFADKVVDDDVLLPGDHVDLLILASPHPAVSVQPGKQLNATFTKDLKTIHLKFL